MRFGFLEPKYCLWTLDSYRHNLMATHCIMVYLHLNITLLVAAPYFLVMGRVWPHLFELKELSHLYLILELR